MISDIESKSTTEKTVMYNLHYQLMMSKSNHIPSMKGVCKMSAFDAKYNGILKGDKQGVFTSDKPFQILYQQKPENEDQEILTVDCGYPVNLFRSFIFMASDLMILLRTWSGDDILVLTKESHSSRAWTILDLGKENPINRFKRIFEFQLPGEGLTHHLMLAYKNDQDQIRLKMIRYGWGHKPNINQGYCWEINFCGPKDDYFEPVDIFGPFPHNNSSSSYDYRYHSGPWYVILCNDEGSCL